MAQDPKGGAVPFSFDGQSSTYSILGASKKDAEVISIKSKDASKSYSGIETYFKSAKKISEQILANAKKTADYYSKGAGGSELKDFGFPARFTYTGKMATQVPGAPNSTYRGGGGGGGTPVAGAPAAGGGGEHPGFAYSRPSGAMIAGAAAIGAATMGYQILPNTNAAVAQRIAAQSVASFSGMSATQFVSMTNSMNRGGITGAYDMQLAGANMLYQGGYLGGTRSFNNVMNNVGGFSVLTGMSNQDVATAFARTNGMNTLRMGIQARDSGGNLRRPDQVVDQLYNRMFTSGVSQEEVGLVYNPGSYAYKNVMMAAGGDPNLFNLYAQGLMAQAKNGGRQINANSPDEMMDLLGLPKNDPMRANYRYQGSEAGKLEASGNALVTGYSATLKVVANLNDAFTRLYEAIKPVSDAFASMKGVGQTLPGAGGMGGALSSLASAGGTALSLMGGSYLASRATQAAMAGGGAATAGRGLLPMIAGGGRSAYNFLARNISKAGLRTFGPAGITSILGGLIRNGAETNSARSVIGSAMQWGGTGAMIGSMILPGWGTAIGAGLGTIYGAVTGGGTAEPFGIGGGDDAAATSAFVPPVSGPVTSNFGPRKDPNKKGTTSTHKGIDYGVKENTPVHAAGDGIVSYAGQGAGYGNYVVIKHGDGTTSLYAHLNRINVRVGDRLLRGQVLGLSGGRRGAPGAGNSTGPHLHFELRKNSTPVNPTSFFKGAISAVGGAIKTVGRVVGSAMSIIKNIVTKPFSSAATAVTGKDSAMMERLDSGLQSLMNPAKSVLDLISGGVRDGVRNRIMSGDDTATSPAPPAQSRGEHSGPGSQGVLPAPSSGKGIVGGSHREFAKFLYDVGFRGQKLRTAFAVALAESSGRAGAHNFEGRDKSYGIFQINMKGNLSQQRLAKTWNTYDKKQFKLTSEADLYDPRLNAQVAYHMSNHGRDWSAWTTYTKGRYKEFLPTADKAIAEAHLPSYKRGAFDVNQDQLAVVHKKEMIIPQQFAEAIRQEIKTGGPSHGGSTELKVNMQVNIARATQAEAAAMVEQFAKMLERKDIRERLGRY